MRARPNSASQSVLGAQRLIRIKISETQSHCLGADIALHSWVARCRTRPIDTARLGHRR
uniref:Uncharacterized protein n=1 Tax=Ralstonia solanacearum TaxID=305 RepID=A0A0S4VPS3_RALSL|nr:protein of unknown function [Ralstonia solanacearum]CUV36551.1 protein of unknown function [Ralstonia solanacearum]